MDTFKLAGRQADMFSMPVPVTKSVWSIDGDEDVDYRSSDPDVHGSKVSLKQEEPSKTKRNVKRKNSISSLNPESNDVETIQIGRPPTRHSYRQHTPGAKWSQSPMGSQDIFVTDHSRSRPMTPRSMNFSLDEEQPAIPEDSLINALHGVNTTKDKAEPNNNHKGKKLFIGVALILAIVCAIVTIATILVLASNDKNQGDSDKSGNTGGNSDEESTTRLTTSARSEFSSTSTETPHMFDTNMPTTMVNPQVNNQETTLAGEGNNVDQTYRQEETTIETMTTYHPEQTTMGTPTTTRPSLVIEETENITYGGTWSTWSGYSGCSVSCAGGVRHRSRICETSPELECQGVSRQTQRCNTVLCPLPDLESSWSTWSAWSTCSHSCHSGTQTRDRSCLDDVNDIVPSCIGSALQTRTCNEIPCPDCSTQCEEGTLDDTCSYCRCTAQVTGQVMSNTYLPLANVTFSLVNAPTIILAISTEGGFFTIEEICSSQMYVLRKAGYVDTDISLSNGATNITMDTVVTLQMSANPIDTMGVNNEAIHICCEASGNPPPDYYEWMKDGLLVHTDYTNSRSTFSIQTTTANDTGYYTCRASNDYSAVVSSTATVHIRDSANDFCTNEPHSNIVSLPDGCIYDGNTTIDKGGCDTNPCYGGETDHCSSRNTHCCGPASLSRVNIDCGTYELPVFLVTSCGCNICQQPEFTIYGFAGSRNGDPLQYGDIFWNGTLVGNTSFDGTFSFTVEATIARVSVLFVDSYNSTFMDSTYVFEMASNNEDSQYIRVFLLRRGRTTQLNATAESSLEVNSSTIDFPPNSFYTTDGQLYQGEVTASVTTIDPADIEELASAPGDFSIIDEEGENQPLVSYGMFAMVFEDEDGNRLSIPGEITITVTSESIANNTEDIKVWTLNPDTGLWVFASDLIGEDDSSDRRKRQIDRTRSRQPSVTATLRGISIDMQWFNFDAIPRQTCVVKVRLFHGNDFLEQHQMPGGQVSIVLQDTTGYNSLSTIRVDTDDPRNSNGYCMVLPCNSARSSISQHFRGYIFADYENEELIPAPRTSLNGLSNSDSNLDLNFQLDYEIEGNKIQVNFDERLVHDDQIGPFYNWERKWRYSSVCSNAEFDKNHFRFYRNYDHVIEIDAYDILPADRFQPNPQNLLLWYDLFSFFPRDRVLRPRFWSFQTCFIKVNVRAGTRVQAISYVADEQHPFYGHIYGTRQDLAYTDSVCLEVRLPGFPIESIDDPMGFYETKTKVEIRTVGTEYYVTEVSQSLINTYSEDVISSVDSNVFELELGANRGYGFNYGIYCSFGDSLSSVKNQAKYMCRNGDGSATPRQDTTSSSPAATFGPANGMVDILLLFHAFTSAPDSDINNMVEFVRSLRAGLELGLNNALMAFGTDSGSAHLFYSTVHMSDDDFLYVLRRYLNRNYLFGSRLVSTAETILNYYRDGVPRPDAPDVVILFSEGDHAYNAQSFINDIESQARVLLVGTPNTNWANLNQFNSHPEDRFTIDQVEDVLRVLQTI